MRAYGARAQDLPTTLNPESTKKPLLEVAVIEGHKAGDAPAGKTLRKQKSNGGASERVDGLAGHLNGPFECGGAAGLGQESGRSAARGRASSMCPMARKSIRHMLDGAKTTHLPIRYV